jgi:ribonuclease PH
MRKDGRPFDALRPVRIFRHYLKDPEGSVFIEMGNTKVICTVSVEEKVPNWMKNSGVPGGWITAEYGMLPRSTTTRTPRDANRQSGRTMEIQRLIGRSLRSVADLSLLGERTLWVDCDVIQADGGTRTASITGSFVAVADALHRLMQEGKIQTWPLYDFLSAVSVGIVQKEILLDLNYEEDSTAEVDMNVVMTQKGNFVELQATGERNVFSREELNELLFLAEKGIKDLILIQKEALSDLLSYFSEGKGVKAEKS